MFDQRPSDAAATTSRAFETARVVVDVGTRSTRAVRNGGKRLIAAYFCFLAAMLGFSALDAPAAAATLGGQLLISGAFIYAGRWMLLHEREG